MTPLAEIARQAWLDCPLDGDHWEATVQAVRSKVIEEAIEAVKEFHWTLPFFSEKRDNELSDDVAEAITLQIIEALTALKDKADGS